MDDNDFKDLYDLMRGNPDAMAVLDIQSMFQRREYDAVAERLAAIRERYYASKFRTLRMEVAEGAKGRSKQQLESDRRTLRKQKKYLEVVEKLDELLAAIDPIVQRALAKGQQKKTIADIDSHDENESTDDEDTDFSPAAPETTSSIFDQFAVEFDAANATEQNALIDRCFAAKKVSTPADIIVGDLYLIDGGHDIVLAVVQHVGSSGRVKLTSPINGQRLKSLDTEVFVKLGVKGRLLHLAVKQDTDADIRTRVPERSDASDSEANDDDDDIIDSSGQVSSMPGLEESAEIARILDKGAFSQLADALQRSGIGSGTEIIVQVRDREFRRGEFQEALQALEGVYGKFSASVASRAARLRQEDLDRQSGRTKMSPKEIQAKRIRDNTQNQLVDRARTRFSRVLDGLRVLLRTYPPA